ncbi:hypothetical protein [Nisaea sp.]|uniref:hypothetical protein n=1 Tax=Nisaea sp. TaxID=2024842 RepID=UPI0032F0467D
MLVKIDNKNYATCSVCETLRSCFIVALLAISMIFSSFEGGAAEFYPDSDISNPEEWMVQALRATGEFGLEEYVVWMGRILEKNNIKSDFSEMLKASKGGKIIDKKVLKIERIHDEFVVVYWVIYLDKPLELYFKWAFSKIDGVWTPRRYRYVSDPFKFF